MIETTKEFIDVCRLAADADDVFTIFEDETSEDVRDYIYSLADPASPEPFRSAMINLGTMYDIPVLRNY